MHPLISVVIPTFNSSHLLRDALESVFAQTIDDYEIIVVDDGSTDKTQDLVESYTGRIRYYRLAHMGASMARWFGVSNSTGKYIAALDADDIWLPTKLSKQVQAMEAASQFGLCYTDGYRWVAGQLIQSSPRLSRLYGEGKSGWQFDLMFKICPAPTSSMFFRRDAYDFIGGYDVKLRYCDAEFVIRMSARYPMIYIAEPLVAYRVHSSNTSSSVHKHNAVSNLNFLRSIRSAASARLPSSQGDISIRIYRRGPSIIQWILLLYWRLTHGSVRYTFSRIRTYAKAIVNTNTNY